MTFPIAPPEPPQPKPTLLTLPAEIRLRIYAFLIPTPVFPIDLCSRRRPSSPTTSSSSPTIRHPPRKQSIAALLLARTHDLTDLITNQNGLQLLFVCRLFNTEVYPVLMKTTVWFCCAKHFVEVVKAFQYGVGEGRRWMRSVQVLCDLREGWEGLRARPKEVAVGRMVECRRAVLGWYGRLDLGGRERWTVEPVRNKGEGEGKGDREDGAEGDDDGVGGVNVGGVAQQQQQQGQSGLVYMNSNGTLGQTPGLRNTRSVDRWIIKGQFDPDWETADS